MKSHLFNPKSNFLLCLCVSMAVLGLSSCAEMAKDMGLDEVPDFQQRAGLTGSQDNPAVLDPFKKYNLVMAANECRFFTMKVPEHWYWKLYLTAANPKRGVRGHLEAEIASATPPWDPLPAADFRKSFDLEAEGLQAVLGVGNSAPTRLALLKLCQDGAPLHITIESQVSSTTGLIGPGSRDNKALKGE